MFIVFGCKVTRNVLQLDCKDVNMAFANEDTLFYPAYHRHRDLSRGERDQKRFAFILYCPRLFVSLPMKKMS